MDYYRGKKEYCVEHLGRNYSIFPRVCRNETIYNMQWYETKTVLCHPMFRHCIFSVQSVNRRYCTVGNQMHVVMILLGSALRVASLQTGDDRFIVL